MNSMIEQVKSLPKLLGEVFTDLDEKARLNLHPDLVLSLKRITITGCGDSHHAGLTTKLAFEKLAGVPTTVDTALQFARYEAGFLPQTGPKTNLVIGISVSGSVARTYEALHTAKEAGAVTLALTATPDSRVASAGEILFQAPNPTFEIPEGEVSPGVRSFFINQVALLLMAVRIGEVRGHINTKEANQYRDQIKATGEIISDVINTQEDKIHDLAKSWKDAEEFVFVGGGPNFGTALFSAAKILEASGDPALGQDTEEWGHLQYFAREPQTPTILITAADRDLSRMLEVAKAAKQIGRRVAVICPEGVGELAQLADVVITYSPMPEMFSSLVTQIAGELFAAYRTEVIGETFFRGFEGGRSIEEGGGISRIRTSEVWESWQK
jgi:glutamine---fructose-6-phosphate transaminase (isomerizing)